MRRRSLARSLLTVGIGVALGGGVAAGAAVVANAATSNGAGQPASSLASGSSGQGSSNGSGPGTPPMDGPHGFGGAGRGIGMGGPVVHGQATVQGPNGYETVDERTGTVSDISNTSGSTWSLTVKSTDGTSGTFTVDSGTSVNGGEAGISSVKQGDTVRVVAVENNGTATAKTLVDRTVLQNNGNSWMPRPPTPSNPSPSS